MAKHKDKEQQEEAKRELTRKEERLRHRDRERHKRLYTLVGVALGLALLLVVVGIVYQLAVVPNRSAVKVGETTVSATDFWKRVRLERFNLLNQLARYQELETQMGGQGVFNTQIAQLQATLASNFSIGAQAMDGVVEDLIVAQEAERRGITVSDEEVENALREEIANSQGLVTIAQATATAEANAGATATAALWTPTAAPTVAPTVAPSATVTTTDGVTDTVAITDSAALTEAVAAPVDPLADVEAPTPAPLPTPVIITDTLYSEGLTNVTNSLSEAAGMTLEDYRAVVRARLLREKLSEIVGSEVVTPTEAQVSARHILLRVREPEPEPTPLPEGAAPEPTATPLPEGFPTPAPTPEPRDDAATLALANELRARILAGEDFAALAAEYSDDVGSGQNGGDLGWFGRGMMVAPFEEAAFSLPVGEVSEPVKTDFGYHLIEVTERDEARVKDEATLANEQAQAFQTWLQELIAAAQVERGNVNDLLPTDF
ncbi:MAG: peptidylprolyl isomerase [Caldilineaceae bacterium]|nr:peptidylprolyl isomerase [Caldilineaceae bacterium]